jgi:predicted ribosome quality control (RQC) complex YloA/Tae2 family protein
LSAARESAERWRGGAGPAGRAVVEFPSFDRAMDAYYTVAEDQKLEAQKAQQKKAALSKVERVRKAQEDSIRRLQEEEEANFARASLIEANLAVVDNAILVVNSLLAQGADWGALKKMVKEEARKGNPIASLIHGLKLDQNTAPARPRPRPLLYRPALRGGRGAP